MASGTSGASAVAVDVPWQSPAYVSPATRKAEAAVAGPTESDAYTRVDSAVWGALTHADRVNVRVNARTIARHIEATRQEKGEVLGSAEWTSRHMFTVPSAPGAGAPSPLFALSIVNEEPAHAALVLDQLKALHGEGRFSAVSAVQLRGVVSLKILEALVEYCGRTLRIVDLSAASHANRVALAIVLGLPQLHELDVCVSPLTGVQLEALPLPDELVRMVATLPQSTLVHLRVYGKVSPSVAWDPARYLSYLRTYALYGTETLPVVVPVKWTVRREIHFQSPRTMPWSMAYGLEAENELLPDLGSVHPGSQHEVTVPI